MRLPFPERIPLIRVVIFCVVLCAVQQLEGTSLLFSGCTFAFIVIATVAFNLTGGFSVPSGTYIFAYAVLTAILGITYKAFVGEPGQSNLQQPELTIEVYLATITMILLSAYIARRLRLKKSYLPNFASNEDMRRVSIACFLLGGGEAIATMLRTSVVDPGSLAAVARVLFSGLLTLAIVFGVLAEIKRSNGRRSVNSVVIASCLIIFSTGILGYSKEGMLAPFVSWLIPAASQRYKVSLLQIAGFGVALAFVVYYLVPYSQYGRNYRIVGGSFSENLKINVILLSELETVRQAYNQKSLELYYGSTYSHYYNNPQGLFDRLQMLTPDDLVINFTENVQSFGFLPTIFAFENTIPHFIWHDKPAIGWGNVYARELGLLSEDDDTTGISFSPTGDLYHQGRWVGILVVLPLLLIGLFFVTDSVCGDTRLNPFALAATIGFLHAAPEAGAAGIIGPGTTGIVSFIVVSFVLTRFMPLVAELFLGRIRVQSRRLGPALSKPTLLQGPEVAGKAPEIDLPAPMYRWSKGKQRA